MDLGPVGLWTFALRRLEAAELSETVAELETLGYGAIWFPAGPSATAFDHASALLESSRALVVATGIVSIWGSDPAVVGERTRALRSAHGGRFLPGLGVSHPELVDRKEAGRYQRPVEAMTAFLDALDQAGAGGGRDQQVLAALGPRMLRLAAESSLGAHPYFVPVEHTAMARETLGPSALLAPEQAVLLEADPSAAREAARAHMQGYLQLRNYAGNLRRLGYGDDDLSGPSDRLVDAIVAWGDEEAIARRVREHREAGADHVCLQVLGRTAAEAGAVPMDEWRRLAGAFA